MTTSRRSMVGAVDTTTKEMISVMIAMVINSSLAVAVFTVPSLTISKMMILVEIVEAAVIVL